MHKTRWALIDSRAVTTSLPLGLLLAGDCCTRSCVDSKWNTCSTSDHYCVDPDHLSTPAPTAPATPSDSSTPAPTVFAWPDCNLGGYPTSFVGDSDCDTSLNTEDCGYDGGELKKSDIYICVGGEKNV